MGEGVVLAGFWRRAVALLVDLALAGFLLLLVGPLVGGWTSGTIALGGALLLAYFLLPETTSTRATPGKRALGLAVADAAGGPVGAGRAAARAGLKLVSCLTFGLGFALAAVTRRKQALHDVMTGCLVVRR